MKSRVLLLLATTFLLSACGLSDEQKADYDQVARAGVSPAIYDKMVHGDPLSINDIIAISKARVNDGVIIRYIRDHGAVYFLDSSDVQHLRNEGVSQSVVDYMLQTSRNYGDYPYPGPYWYGPPIFVGVGFGFHHHHHR